MGAVTAMGVAGIASTAASSGMSFYQMTQQRKLQVQAQEAAKKSISEARKRLEVNYMDALSIVKEPYELERDALLSSGAQSMEAARESQRGVAGTAGRLQMAQNAQQGQVRTAMGRDLMGLEQKSLTEEARLRDENVILDLAETSGAQLAQSNAWEMQQAAMQNAFKGVSSMAGQFAKLAPENYGDANLDTGGGQYNDLNFANPAPETMNNMTLNPQFQGMPLQDIIGQFQASGALPPDLNDIDYSELFKLIYQ